ncbi:protein ACCELERATED CELL DEATH 6-like [Mercurialis annua]|uniref:protein ACCELERATED CELL DEATH 6-like n=1 Tax=Mercurialis annua TaxID=3986 RepID=UPI00215F549C|nr:protein ACCELERATED CELL DEATH 6-like [Mercurialis annua]
MEDGNENRRLALYKAAVHGHWNIAKTFFDEDPNALTLKISGFEEIALYVAITSGHSIEFVRNIVELMSEELVGTVNRDGNNPLHAAAMVGNLEAAKILVKKNATLTQGRNVLNATPLHYAATYAHEQTVRFLLTVTRHENPSPFFDTDGVRLLNSLITADFYGIALDLLKRYPDLGRGRDQYGYTALDMLARKPRAFPSGSRIGFFEFLFDHYWCRNVSIKTDFADDYVDTKTIPKYGDLENQVESSEDYYQKKFKQFPFLQHIEKKMLMHKQAMELLKLLISEALKANESELYGLLGPSTQNAAILGIQEFVAEAIKSYPYLVWFRDRDGCTVFLLAIKHRQEKVFNLLYQIGNHKHIITSLSDTEGNNMLHLAAKSNPSNRISGAALQMQRELQWFKEVEKVVQPSYKEMEDRSGRTPRELFTKDHESLVSQGEKWMKDTAMSCATVAALVITVVFAAAFTVPGGNNSDQGIPIYLNQTAFMIFAISDAFGLFSSSTSLLMFLGILTSRYSEEDFRRALPMRLSIGLITLFFSIASMLIAFSAAFHLVLFHKVKWIAVPIGLLACAPVTLFALLQFPLLLEMVCSTFGHKVFRKQSDEIIF